MKTVFEVFDVTSRDLNEEVLHRLAVAKTRGGTERFTVGQIDELIGFMNRALGELQSLCW